MLQKVNVAKRQKKIKVFSHEKIKAQIAGRKHIPNYEKLLMESAVHVDEKGVTFDSNHPSWKKLVKIVKQENQKDKTLLSSETTSTTKRATKTITIRTSPKAPKKRITMTAQLKATTSPSASPKSSQSTTSLKMTFNLTEKTLSKNKKIDRKTNADNSGDIDIPNNKSCSSSKVISQKMEEELEKHLKEERPDIVIIRQSCNYCGVPEKMRGSIWKVLLLSGNANKKRDWWSVRHSRISSKKTQEDPENLPNQSVIRADVARTLPHLARFRDVNVRHDMEMLLTEYCKSENISYKQGMNYVLAPFFLVLTELRDIYNCFCAFISRFLHNTYSDEDFGGLQCVFTLFRFLLLYHDPTLCNYLEQYDMGPELYASSWFMTVYANRLKPELLFHLWDMLILDLEHPHMHYFFSLSLLISHRNQILKADVIKLPEMLSKLTADTTEKIVALAAKAKHHYWIQSPRTFHNQLNDLTRQAISMDSLVYQQLCAIQCLPVSAREIVDHCYDVQSGDKKKSLIKYFIIDCRPIDHYENGHLPYAYHLNPNLLQHPEVLASQVQSLSAMKGCHFCFLDEGTSNSIHSSAVLRLYFLQKGFKYISNCEGGFAACHKILVPRRDGYELVDHNQQACKECMARTRKGRRQRQKKIKFEKEITNLNNIV